MTINQKLYMENFDPNTGTISFVVEDDNRDRIARAEFTNDYLKEYSPLTMDFFVLSYLPAIIDKDVRLCIEGPLSVDLLSVVAKHTPSVIAEDLVDIQKRDYNNGIIKFLKQVFNETQDLNKTLAGVFNYYN